MNCRRLIAVALLGSGLATSWAQAPPDFSGTWTQEANAAEQPSVVSAGDLPFAVGSMGSGWGSPLTIRQSSQTLEVEYVHFRVYDLQPPLRLRFNLDGADSSNTLMLGHTTSTLHSRAERQQGSLVISTRVPVPAEGAGAEHVDMRQVLTLESPGTLVIETTRTGPGGAAPSVTRTRYSKTG